MRAMSLTGLPNQCRVDTTRGGEAGRTPTACEVNEVLITALPRRSPRAEDPPGVETPWGGAGMHPDISDTESSSGSPCRAAPAVALANSELFRKRTDEPCPAICGGELTSETCTCLVESIATGRLGEAIAAAPSGEVADAALTVTGVPEAIEGIDAPDIECSEVPRAS
mmetsp:Transcript_72213/g.174926  ORF Transcript_72213/g.174926 Transcript_72213/m.174926 type:complete len:168 (+) Transcript_72213:39-542(+)